MAKLELSASLKEALRGSAFFATAAATALFSLFFFWLMIAEIIAIWLPRWAAFVIVFVVMLLIAALLGVPGPSPDEEGEGTGTDHRGVPADRRGAQGGGIPVPLGTAPLGTADAGPSASALGAGGTAPVRPPIGS